MAVVQQLSSPSAPTVTPKIQKLVDNKGDSLCDRDANDLNGFFDAILVPLAGTFRLPFPNQLLQNFIRMNGANNCANAQRYEYLLPTDGATLTVPAEDGNDLPKGAFVPLYLSALNVGFNLDDQKTYEQQEKLAPLVLSPIVERSVWSVDVLIPSGLVIYPVEGSK